MHAYQDFREFLSVLEQQKQLLRITDPVKLEPDLTAASAAATRLGNRSPALMFNNIAGYQSQQIVTNVHGSWTNHALALGMDPDTGPKDQFLEFVRRYRLYPGQLQRVTSAPWQEVVIDKDINLFEILRWFLYR
jgi:4-hydroxybenzoate decarboxylase